MLRYFVMLACLCIFTACERASELTKSPDPLGDFSLGYSVVVAPHPVAGPMSRPASDENWIANAEAVVASDEVTITNNARV